MQAIQLFSSYYPGKLPGNQVPFLQDQQKCPVTSWFAYPGNQGRGVAMRRSIRLSRSCKAERGWWHGEYDVQWLQDYLETST